MIGDRKTTGYTLVEVLLSISVLVALTAFSVPFYQSFQYKGDLTLAAASIAQTIRKAETLAAASSGDSLWGIMVSRGSIVAFKGSSYAARDSVSDDITAIPTSVSVSGSTELVFNKVTGYPVTTGTISLTGANKEVRSVRVNTKGVVNY